MDVSDPYFSLFSVARETVEHGQAMREPCVCVRSMHACLVGPQNLSERKCMVQEQDQPAGSVGTPALFNPKYVYESTYVYFKYNRL
jgi:hypothetical protein